MSRPRTHTHKHRQRGSKQFLLYIVRGSDLAPFHFGELMSYSFTKRAATRSALRELVIAELDVIAKQQPISAPRDVRRYFVTPRESGELCLMSCLLAANREVFFPKLSEWLHLTTFADVARRFPEVLKARLVVSGEMANDSMHLQVEAASTPEGLDQRISEAIRDVTKLRGTVQLVAPGSLPNDGKVIEDARSYK